MPEETPKLSKQHPVPQHIAAFEFKLIGDLTLKQFLFAGVGIAVAYAAWISNVNFLIKWSTIILAAGLGLGTAFFPLQDRTLDQWLLNFIAAIFSPTQRIWRKEPLPPEYLREDYSRFSTSQVLSLTPLQGRSQLQQYLEEVGEEKSKTELAEQRFIEKLNFDVPLPSAGETEPRPTPEPEPEPEKKLLPERRELPSRPKLAYVALEPTYKIPTEKETKYRPMLKNITPGRKIRIPTIEGTIKVPPPKLVPLPERKLPAPESHRPTVKDLSQIIELERQNIELKARLEQAESQLKSLLELQKELQTKEAYQTRILEQERLIQKLAERRREAQKEISEMRGAKEVEESKEIPTVERRNPNTAFGVVRDKEGKLLENVVIIIKDQDGDPVRALKTDRLGQFTISTPLENGKYTVEVSHKERSFAIIDVTTDGSVLPPLEFREKNG